MSVNSDLVSDWIAFTRLPDEAPEREVLLDATSSVWEMTRNDPNQGWLFVLSVLQRDSSNRVLESLSAGPLEDLLAYHGRLLIEKVEAEARCNPKFAKLLGGVWQNDMPDSIWQRVQAVWDRRGWDNEPAA